MEYCEGGDLMKLAEYKKMEESMAVEVFL